MIPYLRKDMENFGDIDGDGVPEDASEAADRVKAWNWLVDETIRRWDPAAYPHLRLWGFYWMMEGIQPPDEPLVRQVADHIHARGYGFHWIPWFKAPGYDRWQEAGFDFAVMQPNYAFRPVPPRAAVPDNGRLSQNAWEARTNGLGVEMELSSNVATSPGQLFNLQLYLHHGIDELDGYMNGAARAWYQSSDLLDRCYRSPVPAISSLYDDVYRFHKGTYQRTTISLCEGAPATINGASAPTLTDGLWFTRPEHADRVVTTHAPATIQIDFGHALMVGDVRLHLAASERHGIVAPRVVSLSVSSDGSKFEKVAEMPAPQLLRVGDYDTGFAVLPCHRRLARAIRIELAGNNQTVACDEVLIYPAPHLLWGNSGEVDGDIAQEASAGAYALTDGCIGAADGDGIVCGPDGASVTFDLGEKHYLSAALAHVRWQLDTPPPTCAVALSTDADTWQSDVCPATGEGDAWIEIPIHPTPAHGAEFALSGGPGVIWDELQLTRADNLASGKPYALSPKFPAQYSDDGNAELTDGILTEDGFSDGRTVGWHNPNTPVAVILDLGDITEIDAVSAYTEGGGLGAVHHPHIMETWCSTDGREWELLTATEPERNVTLSATVAGSPHELAWLTQHFDATETRFLRLRFVSSGWLMLSEIRALSAQTNVAAGRSYHLQPIPTSEAPYADSGARLTDGAYTTTGSWKDAVGWNMVDPEIIVDLLDTHTVATARVHCIGGGHGAVFFPDSIAFATSVDGRTWSDDVFATEHPEESGSEAAVCFMETTFTPRQARYVRVRVNARVWRMIDEIEFYAD